MYLENISKSFFKDNKTIKVLENLNAKFEKGKFYIILGASGAGKSTLINLLGLLDTFDNGKYMIEGTDTLKLNDSELSKLRMKKIGMVFQDYFLNPRLNAFDNVYMAALINDEIKKENRNKAVEKVLSEVGLKERFKHYPDELSGGEQQRVCIARAIVNDPDYILADEPTGALDSENAKKIMNMFEKIVQKGKTVILVTHDLNNLKYGDVIYFLENKKLIEKSKNDIIKKYNKKK